MVATLTIPSLAAAEWWAAKDGTPISRDRVRYIMRQKGLRVIYQKPRTSIPGNRCERFPCLADPKLVTAVEQVWATDITDIPLQKGCLHLMAVVDSSQGICSAGGSPTALTRSSVWILWRWRSLLGESQRSIYRIRVDSSLYQSSLAGRRRLKSSVLPPEHNDARPQTRPVNGTHLTACRSQNGISGSRRLLGKKEQFSSRVPRRIRVPSGSISKLLRAIGVGRSSDQPCQKGFSRCHLEGSTLSYNCVA
jgi:hypothetical protein